MDLNNGLSRRDQLCHLIQQWNQNRLPLFSLSEPNQEMEFYGVMRFYYKEPGEKVTTKCIRVSSLATTADVIDALIEKFKPDMRLLNQDVSYEILEIHENGEERKLDNDEHPLFVQLAWHKNDREGRFLLRSSDAPQYLPLAALQFNVNSSAMKRSNKRFSKREKKESKKSNKISGDFFLNSDDVGKKLYEELPHNTFTRTISNPEAVMKKRREQKLENKLKEISYNGSHGGSLKIYGADLVPSRPYVTLLVSEHDTAYKVLQAALEKYGLEKERVENFVLVEVTFASGALSRSFSDLKTTGQHRERCLLDDECPLVSLSQHLLCRDVETIFVMRLRPANFPPQHQASQASPVKKISTGPLSDPATQCAADPVLLPITNGVQCAPFVLKNGLNEIGSDFSISGLMLRYPTIQPRHCMFNFADGVVTVTALDTNALVEVNGNPINCSIVVRNMDLIRLGGLFEFVFRRSFAEHQQQQQQQQQSNNNNNSLPCDKLQSFPINNYSSSEVTQFDAATDTVTSIPRPTSNMTLPGLLELPDQVSEECLLQEMVDKFLPSNYGFRLSSVFCFYMACRYRLLPPEQFHQSNNLYYKERLRSVPAFISAITSRVYRTVHINPHNKELSLYWLANMSEFLHIIKRDNDLNALLSSYLQSQIMETVERCLDVHIEVCKMELQNCMSMFLDLNSSAGEEAHNIVHLLNDLVLMYRRSRLNPALIIQSFSELFHYVNMYTFNWLIGPSRRVNLTRFFALRFHSRIQAIYHWAEKQGLEFAAECHFDRITQALKLLMTPKTIDQIGNLGSTCYKLNSIQVRFLLEYYQPDHSEMPVPRDLIDSLVHLAQTQADKSALEEGQRIQLEESPVLGLSFLFPQDGYVVDSQRGIPSDMLQLISELERAGICRFIQCNSLSGSWTVHLSPVSVPNLPFASEIDSEYASVQSNRFGQPMSALPASMNQLSLESNNRSKPQRIFVQIRRPSGAGIGLSIVAAQGIGDRHLGIYVKKVVEGSIAYREGHLETGDQLLSVNNFSLLNVTQEVAAQKIAEAGAFVQLEVAKYAASFNGLDSWLKNSNFVRRSQPQLSNANLQPMQLPSSNMTELGRHYRSASASELYSQPAANALNLLAVAEPVKQLTQVQMFQADTASISSNQPSSRPQLRYRSAQKPQIIPYERPSVTARMSTSNLEPPPVYNAVSSTRSSSTVPFNVMPSYSTSAVLRPSSPQKSLSTSNFPASGRRSAPLFNSQAAELGAQKTAFSDFQNKNSNYLPTICSNANLPLTNRTQKVLQLDRRIASVNPVRNDYKLPFLNEINTKFIELNNSRDKSSATTSTSRLHPDGFADQIDQLEQTANSCDNPQRTPLGETGSPDERHKKRVQFATEISSDDLKENGHTSTSSNASDSPRPKQVQKPSVVEFDPKTIESTSGDNEDEEDVEPRTQILGTHEIYNDPRHRRLNELQARLLKPVMDGSNMNFRDKMKMFASQLGEQSPKDKFKMSSAQRDIQMDS